MSISKQSGTAYLFWLGGMFGLCGLHRFYIGNYATGFLWLFTFGFCGLGQFIDLFLIPGMVGRRNAELRRLSGDSAAAIQVDSAGIVINLAELITLQSTSAPQSVQTPMQKLLVAAQANDGTLSIAQAALATQMDTPALHALLLEAQRDGYAEIYNDDISGAVRYRFDV